MKKILMASLAFLWLSISVACQEQVPNYDIYVTVYPMQYVVSRIAKGHVSVGIVPGVSSHQTSIDWSPKEVISMSEATFLFYVGANYDAYIDKQVGTIFANKRVQLIKIETALDALGELYVPFIEGTHHSHDEDNELDHHTNVSLGLDPHFWISPKRLILAARLVYEKLIEEYPQHETIFEINYLDLLVDLNLLSDAFTTILRNQSIPIMTATNIYGYLHADYDLHYIPISQGYHEETEYFTAEEKSERLALAVTYQIRHIIYETNSDSPLSVAVFDALVGLGYQPVKLEYHVLQSLFRKDLLESKNYLTIMHENLEVIKTATNYQIQE